MNNIPMIMKSSIQSITILLAFVHSAVAIAESSNLASASIEIGLSNTVIHAGEPMELTFGVSRPLSGGEERVNTVQIKATQVLMSVYSTDGSTVSSSVGQAARIGGAGEARDLMEFDLRKAESATITRAFQEWCSTELLAGEYIVRCTLPDVKLIAQQNDRRYSYTQSNSKIWEFPLRVLDRDDDRVRNAFDRWEQLATSLTSGTSSLMPNSPGEHAIEMIVYAKTPLAVPYQLRLLQGNLPLRFNHIFDLACQLVSVPQAKTATELLKTLESSNSGDWWKHKVLSWMIFKLHESGDPEIAAITQEYVETHKRPIDPDKGAP